jgi:hypothetical protein
MARGQVETADRSNVTRGVHPIRARSGGGHALAATVIATEPAESRQTFDDAMEAVVSLRHRARSLIFALAVEEKGISIREVGRLWGVSRQLASRYV